MSDVQCEQTVQLPAQSCLPMQAEVVEVIQETPSIVTLRLHLLDAEAHAAYEFLPGQFNMLYLYGVGEVPISIVSDPKDHHLFDHTIRAVGRVTQMLTRLQPGDRIGVRGPYGRGWPVQLVSQRDLLLVTGGLGCAPVVSVINYVQRRRDRFGRLIIMQGVKHSADLLWSKSYEKWAKQPNTQVVVTADKTGRGWPWNTGQITELFDDVEFDPNNCLVMMCGPEGMMVAAADTLIGRGVPEGEIWLSMERNMKCAIGQCGHCQYGASFVCKDGPVFCYSRMRTLLQNPGI